jgi:hypothetical protein
MNPDQLAELKTNEIVRKRLAKLMARDCFRNSTKLEDMHAADQIDDQEMQDLIVNVVDRCYDFLMELCSPQGAEIIEDLKQSDKVPNWNDPRPMIFRHL